MNIELTAGDYLMIVGLVLIGLELIIGIEMGFDLVLLGSILILGSLVSNLTGNFLLALAVCSILVIVYILFGRRLIKRRITVSTQKTNIDELIGKSALVTETITPERAGIIKLNSEKWRAISDQTIQETDKVKVISIEGVSLKVEKIK